MNANNGNGKTFGGLQVRCPHPGCGHVGDIITKAHCRMCHDMEREDIFEQFGPSQPVEIDAKAFGQNRRVKSVYWNNSPVLGGKRSKF
jgi:hypothetical protein